MASAAVAWMLLIPPVSESHYFVVLLLPLAVLTGEARAPVSDATRRLACMTLIGFGALSLVGVSMISIQPYGPLCWATVGLWATLVILTAWKAGGGQPPVSLPADVEE